MELQQDIYSYIKREEANYQLPIAVIDAYDWSMRDHIKLSTLYKNSQFSTGKDDNKPFKNITRPILNLQYRAEGFDVKDITLYVNDRKNYYKSFLVKKFHEKWARKNNMDTFIDELVESYVDYGGALVKNVNKERPEVVPLQSIVFCDQTDILSGPIGIKHFFSPDQLKDMEAVGWGSEANGATITIDEVITLAKDTKKLDKEGKEVKTPGKYIEVYEVHGTLPEEFLRDEVGDEKKYVSQLQIVCFYQKENGEKQGVTLFRGKEKESPFKLILRDKVYGRALGFGGAEELFEPQVWVNYDIIRMKGLLDAAAKIIYQTSDPAFANRNKTNDVENGEILITEQGATISQINTTPVNITLFEKSVAEWEAHAQQIGSANDSIQGVQPTSGTPFKLQELVTQESHSLHEYRKGKLATFVSEIYRDWSIPFISREISKGDEFLAELDPEEMQTVADLVMTNEANKFVKESILNGETIDPMQVESYKKAVRDSFVKGGNKKFIEILAEEMKEAPIDVEVNIAGKQKDLAQQTDKLVNIFRQIMSSVNPQTGKSVLDDPRMAKIFNQILESSGLSPIDMGYVAPQPEPQMQQMPMPQEQLQAPQGVLNQ